MQMMATQMRGTMLTCYFITAYSIFCDFACISLLYVVNKILALDLYVRDYMFYR